jgi:Tfp pilus assembly protein PilF
MEATELEANPHQDAARRWGIAPLWRYPLAPLRWARLIGPQRSGWRGLAVASLVVAIVAWFAFWQAYALRHWSSGNQQLQADRSSQALEHFQAALRVWPGNGPTLLAAARAARRSGDFELADQYLRLCQDQPALSDQAALERVLLRASQGDVDSVADYCRILLHNDVPETPLILEALALGNIRLLRFGDADALLNLWLERSPGQPQAIFLKGRLNLLAGNSQEAMQFLREVIELDPTRDDARLMLAGLCLELGQAQEAWREFEVVASRAPLSATARARSAEALVLLGRSEEAAAILDELLLEYPEMPVALLERGKIALRNDELGRAETLLTAACAREPGNRAAHYQLLQCLKLQGKSEETRALEQKLDQIDGDVARLREIVNVELPRQRFDPELQAELGELLMRAGAWDDALSWLKASLAVDPQQPRAHRALADYYQSLGQQRLAEQHRSAAGGSPTAVLARP